ncbi:MAG TPA: hypothetical protein VFS43_15805 [Polyangiaceae bacterium]|nr:hypothetical protein [Polyangiaceae bacterium]
MTRPGGASKVRAATMRAFALPLVACLLPLTAASCGSSGAAAKAAKAPELEIKGQAKCGVSKSHETPLVIEWPDEARVRLERAVAGKLAVVRYEGCDMRLLRGCTVKGSAYRYAPVTPKRSQVVIRNEDELFAKLPVGAVGLEGKLKQAGQLTVDMLMVGRFEADRQQVDRSALEGSCEGATHVVTGLTVGSFHFYTGASASAAGGVDAVLVSGGGSTSAGRETLNQDGNALACEKSAAGDTTPPYGCSAPMVLEVAKVDEPRATAAVTPPPGERPPGTEPPPYGAQPPPYGGQPTPAGTAPNAYAAQPYDESSGGRSFLSRLSAAQLGAAIGAGVGLGVAAVGGVGMAAQRGVVEDECTSATKTCSQKGLDAIDSYKTWAWVANAGLGVFAVSAVTFYLMPRRHDGARATTLGVRPTRGGAALELGGRF